jgi:hypothetical protein
MRCEYLPCGNEHEHHESCTARFAGGVAGAGRADHDPRLAVAQLGEFRTISSLARRLVSKLLRRSLPEAKMKLQSAAMEQS